MGSSRLPGKVLKHLGGATVLSNVVQRVRQSKLIDDVVVATTVEPEDTNILQECENNGVPVFRGNTNDVLDRYYRAAEHFEIETIVRITADCPLIDAEIIDETVRAFITEGADYASNVLKRTYPRGLDTEVFCYGALQRAWCNANIEYERVHVTPYIYSHPEQFYLWSVEGDQDLSAYRWTLDTPEDWELLRRLYDHFFPETQFSWRAVADLMQQAPELALINAGVRQKELHER